MAAIEVEAPDPEGADLGHVGQWPGAFRVGHDDGPVPVDGGAVPELTAAVVPPAAGLDVYKRQAEVTRRVDIGAKR